MFSGIIQTTSKVHSSATKNGSLFLTFEKPKNWKIKLGDSIATNGVCLTVQALTKNSYTTELMPETLDRTTFGKLVPQTVNLEPSLTLGTLMDGHLVLGHVDTMGKITKLQDKGRSRIYTISFPKKYGHLVVEKGSITIDGISLTIVDCGKDWLSVSLVDYTIEHTTLGAKKIGELVNLEFDIMAKYVARMMKR
jgi:riboflavin synthase